MYYFFKAAPQNLADFYAKPRIVRSLRTKSLSRAKAASRSLSSRLEDYGLGLRLQRVDVSAAHLLVVPYEQVESTFQTIDETLELYLSVKGQSKGQNRPSDIRIKVCSGSHWINEGHHSLNEPLSAAVEAVLSGAGWEKWILF